MYEYIIPKLDQVIPKHIQERLRKNRQKRRSLNLMGDDEVKYVDLRYRDTEIVSQIGARCSAYGMIASIENLLGAPKVARLSESHLWSKYRRYSSLKAVDAAKRFAITEQSMWPHQRKFPYSGWQKKAHTKVAHITFIEDNIEKAVGALNDGEPIYIGMSVTESMEKCDAVLDPESPETGSGHALSISGYRLDKNIPGGGYFILKNSWSTQCGDEGYFYMPFNYCSRGGNSYCVMWKIQGVETAFPGVSSVLPPLPKFDVEKSCMYCVFYNSCL